MEEQKLLPLYLLNEAEEGKVHGRTRLQKLVFLVQQRLDEEIFEYYGHDYGPFSKELLEEMEKQEAGGLVDCKETKMYDGKKKYIYRMTKEGSERLLNLREETEESEMEKLENTVNEVVQEFNKKPLRDLIDYVYEEYPEYTEESIIA